MVCVCGCPWTRYMSHLYSIKVRQHTLSDLCTSLRVLFFLLGFLHMYFAKARVWSFGPALQEVLYSQHLYCNPGTAENDEYIVTYSLRDRDQ